MKYGNIIEGVFLSRPNRFIAKVEINGQEETVHVKNTGRCKELLQKGNRVYLEKASNPERKTKYDLVAVERSDGRLVNMDSQVVNAVAEEWIKKGNIFPMGSLVRREVTHGNSRFDIYAESGERKAFIEVKGVTLEAEGVARFPDAPTERGVKHLRELVECVENGYEAYALFVIQMKGVTAFTPNDGMHKEFGDALRQAKARGVKVIAVDCNITPDSVEIDSEVEVLL